MYNIHNDGKIDMVLIIERCSDNVNCDDVDNISVMFMIMMM